MRRTLLVALAGCLALVAGACFSSNPDPNLDPMSPDGEGASGADGEQTAGSGGSVPSDAAGGSGGQSDSGSGGVGMVEAGSGGGTSANSGGTGGTPAVPGSGDGVCDERGVARIGITLVDKLDLLFVVDDSGSMREEQTALRAEFPHMLQVLADGDTDGDGRIDFNPVRDIHLGVVSSDMGLVGVQGIPGCDGLGDDGIMNNFAGTSVGGCQSAYPRFLSYVSGIHDPQDTATDFACIADLGTDGCGFEQPLEAALKALWPSVDIDPVTGEQQQPNRILFLGDVNGFGQLGHGDTENNGFLRNDPVQGLSVIAVVLVTDEEDCSSSNTRHFTPFAYLPDGDPLREQELNLRCFYNPQNLYVLDRYVNGLRALRPGAEELVVFGAIVGVPPDLVDPAALSQVDFSSEMQREAFYDQLLADPRMQEVPDLSRTSEQGGNLTPSCITDTGRAYPPRRIVEVARRFGENGAVASICQSDFGPAIDAIVRTIARQTGARCLPRPIPRNEDGTIECEVVWELPPAGTAPAGTPVSCAERPFLRYDSDSARGGELCEVLQLPSDGAAPTGAEGWYYDDFSEDVLNECRGDARQRVAFTSDAKPPTGVVVRMACNDQFIACP